LSTRTVCEVEIRNRLPVGALALLVAELVTSPADGRAGSGAPCGGADDGGDAAAAAAAAASPLELLQRAVQFARQRGAKVPGSGDDFAWALPWADRCVTRGGGVMLVPAHCHFARRCAH